MSNDDFYKTIAACLIANGICLAILRYAGVLVFPN